MTSYYSPDPAVFHPTVWQVVRQVPQGIVSTYGQIASIIPAPVGIDAADYARLGARWVGEALNAISFADVDGRAVAPDVPWWRIVNAKGGISLPRGSRAATQQRTHLLAEGVTFDPRGHIDLQAFGWDGPHQDWLTEHNFLTPTSLRKPGGPQQLSLI